MHVNSWVRAQGSTSIARTVELRIVSPVPVLHVSAAGADYDTVRWFGWRSDRRRPSFLRNFFRGISISHMSQRHPNHRTVKLTIGKLPSEDLRTDDDIPRPPPWLSAYCCDTLRSGTVMHPVLAEVTRLSN